MLKYNQKSVMAIAYNLSVNLHYFVQLIKYVHYLNFMPGYTTNMHLAKIYNDANVPLTANI